MNDLIKAGMMAEQVAEAILHDGSQYSLQSRGFKILGAGCFGYVVDVPDCAYVLKVCLDRRDGYVLYARWAKANPMPCLPAFKQVTELSNGAHIIVLPRMIPLTDEQEDFVREVKQGYHHSAPLYHAFYTMRDALGNKASEDTHLGNFMYDPVRNQICITDPYTNVWNVDHVGQVDQMHEQLDLLECFKAEYAAAERALRVREQRRVLLGFPEGNLGSAERAWLDGIGDGYLNFEIPCPKDACYEDVCPDAVIGCGDTFGSWFYYSAEDITNLTDVLNVGLPQWHFWFHIDKASRAVEQCKEAQPAVLIPNAIDYDLELIHGYY